MEKINKNRYKKSRKEMGRDRKGKAGLREAQTGQLLRLKNPRKFSPS
ncbi:MAG: hypothetical protein Q7R78_00330 [bacterium]|nr:hypothetical protein [bacterium]